MSARRYPGIPVELGGKVFLIAALSLAQLEANADKLAALQLVEDNPAEAFKSGAFGSVIDLITLAINRNDPDTTRADVADLVDLVTLKPVVSAMMGIAPTGEAKGTESP